VLQDKEVDGVARKGVVRSTFIIDKQGVIRHALYALDQPRLDIVAAGQLPHLVGRQKAGKARHGVADQERALVPDIAQETGGAQAAKQGRCHILPIIAMRPDQPC